MKERKKERYNGCSRFVKRRIRKEERKTAKRSWKGKSGTATAGRGGEDEEGASYVRTYVRRDNRKKEKKKKEKKKRQLAKERQVET